MVKVDKTNSRGQYVPSSIVSILSIAACGNNSYQSVTAYQTFRNLSLNVFQIQLQVIHYARPAFSCGITPVCSPFGGVARGISFCVLGTVACWRHDRPALIFAPLIGDEDWQL
ncbi:MAG: hypothetical protein GX945_13440 [Lentisphaerae bacterium]|nr:hypothetical protein [Lentisphaerota bacterium]